MRNQISLIKIALAVFLGSAIFAVLSSPADAGDEEVCAGNRPDDAIAACTRLIEQTHHSRDVRRDAYINRGYWHYEKNEFDLAIADDTKAIELDAKSALAYSNRGDAYSKKNDNDRAMKDFEAAIGIDPKNYYAYLGRGDHFREMGQLDRAIADFTHADKLKRAEPGYSTNPDFEALLLRGQAYDEKGQTDLAIKDYDYIIKTRRGSRIDASDANVYNSRAWSYYREGKIEAARPDAETAVRLSPNDGNCLDTRGHIYLKLGRVPEAMSDFSRAVSLNAETTVTSRTGLGMAQEQLGDKDKAVSEYQAALAYSGTDGRDQREARETARARLAALRPSGAGASFASALGVPAAATGAAKPDAPAPSVSAAPAGTTTDPALDQHLLQIKKSTDSLLKLLNESMQGPSGTGQTSLPPPAPAPGPGLAVGGTVPAPLPAPAAAPPPIALAVPPPATAAASIVKPQESLRRVALVLGNGDYAHVPRLANPVRDAAAFAAALRRLGFAEVIEKQNLGFGDLASELKSFGDLATQADWAIIYFAGHGIEVGGVNYVVPVDARLASQDHIDDEALPLSRLLSKAAGARKLRLVFLDSCRNNPFQMASTGQTRSIGRGLAREPSAGGVLVAYAAKDGTVADDGTDAHSPYTQALLDHIEEPGVELDKFFRKVRDKVMALTGGKREPFTYGSRSSEDAFFKP